MTHPDMYCEVTGCDATDTELVEVHLYRAPERKRLCAPHKAAVLAALAGGEFRTGPPRHQPPPLPVTPRPKPSTPESTMPTSAQHAVTSRRHRTHHAPKPDGPPCAWRYARGKQAGKRCKLTGHHEVDGKLYCVGHARDARLKAPPLPTPPVAAHAEKSPEPMLVSPDRQHRMAAIGNAVVRAIMPPDADFEVVARHATVDEVLTHIIDLQSLKTALVTVLATLERELLLADIEHDQMEVRATDAELALRVVSSGGVLAEVVTPDVVEAATRLRDTARSDLQVHRERAARIAIAEDAVRNLLEDRTSSAAA